MSSLFAHAGEQADPFKAAGSQWAPPKTVKPKARAVAVPPTGPAVPTLMPLSRSTEQRLKPNFKGEPVAGITQGHWDEKGGWVKGGLPYYTDAFTLHHFAGPAGQESTRWNAATAAKAKGMQIANYGKPGYIARSLVPGGLDQSGTTSVGKALKRGAEVAATVLPGGGAVEAAGVLGYGLKTIRALPFVKDVAEAAPPAAHATEEAAVLRGAMSGKTAREALKEMGPHEKAGALLDDPNIGKSARTVRKAQEAGYSAERKARVAVARTHLENQSLTPGERIGLAKSELRGELPKIDFQGFSELNDQSLQALQTHILDHPHLMPYQKIRASDALVNALAGKVPTHSELTLLEHIFGKDTALGLGKIAAHPLRDKLLSALNVPRSLMASFDLSAPFRQGLMVSTRHPTIFARNFKSMIKSFGSERVYHGIHDEIRARPTYPMMVEAKLPITELGRDIGAREEQFASDYAEKLTGGKYGPVRASGRAYTGFLDKVRADVFDHLIQRAQAQGIDVQDPKFLQSLGKYIGSATGRGDLGAFNEASKVLNTFFFSPRLLASRLNFLNPLYYARLDPFARKEALRSALQLAGTLSTLVGIASQVPGVKVVRDPRNPDWGKIRIGNTRIDIAGGFQQELRLLAQMATGVAISSTTGKKLSLTSTGFGQPTRLDLLLRFFEGKASPLASLALDKLRNQTQIGQPFQWKSELVSRMTPLLAQDSLDLYNERHGGMNGLAAALGGYGIGMFGLGMQTYGATPKKKKSSGSGGDPFGSSTSGSSGGDPFSPSSSSSSSGDPFNP